MGVNVGVIGLGSIGLRHTANLIAAGAVVTGYDPALERRVRFAAKGGEALDSRDAVIAAADAIVIASPSAQHLDDLAAAVAAAKHAFVEKPLAHTAEAVRAVLDEADSKGLTVVAGLNLRFHEAVVAAKTRLAERAIGEPLWGRFLAASYLPEWRPDQDYRAGYAADAAAGGVLFDFIHEFDLAVHLLGPGETVAAAARRTGCLEIASEDCADVILRHENGVQSTLHVDYVTLPRRRQAVIAGTRGILHLDLEEGRLYVIDREGRLQEDVSFEINRNAMYMDEMKAFLDCIRNGSVPACNGWQALDVLTMVIRARALAGLPLP